MLKQKLEPGFDSIKTDMALTSAPPRISQL